MPLPTYKYFQFPVTAADKGQLLSTTVTTFDLDKNVSTVTGITLNADNRGTLWTFGTSRIELGGREIFPEGFPAFMLMSGITTRPNDKFFRFSEPLAPGTGKLILQFKDTWKAPPAGQPDVWQPYVVTVLLEQTITGVALAPAAAPAANPVR